MSGAKLDPAEVTALAAKMASLAAEDEKAKTLAAFHAFANERLGEIAGRLTRGAKLTLVIRLVDDPDSEIVISNDTEADAIAALERAKARGER